MKILTIEPYPNYHFRTIISKLNSNYKLSHLSFGDVPNFRQGQEWETGSKNSSLLNAISSLFKCDAPIFLGILSPAPKMIILFIIACLIKRKVFVASEGLKKAKRQGIIPRTIFKCLSRITNITFLCIGHNANKDYFQLGFDKANFRKFGFSENYQAFQQEEFEQSLIKYDKDEFHILLAGRLIARKNFSVVLDAIVRILNASVVERKIVVHIAGDGEELSNLQKIVKNTPALDVHFYGHVNSTELAKLYKKSQLFVLPSLYEGWGVVVNNALHYGLPCLCLDSVRSAKGFLVKQNINGLVINEADMDKSLIHFINMPSQEIKRMALASYDFSKLWSTDNFAKELGHLLSGSLEKVPQFGPLSLYPISEDIDV